MTDLGTVDGDPVSGAFHINSRDQVVGTSGPLSGEWVHAFLWENGGPMIDLNTLVRSNSGVQLVSAPDLMIVKRSLLWASCLTATRTLSC